MKVYISGKITGDENYKEKFNRAAEFLKNNGHAPLNPASIDVSLSYEEYMKIDLAMLSVADAIYLLESYKDSKGAMFELQYAQMFQKEVYIQNRNDQELVQVRA